MENDSRPSWWYRCISGEYKGSFKYWMIHWYEYQKVGIENRCWYPNDLFHDILKPWLNLFMPYKYVRLIHRTFSRHHDEYIFCNVNKRQRIIDEFSSWISNIKYYEGDPVENLLDTGYISEEDIYKYIK